MIINNRVTLGSVEGSKRVAVLARKDNSFVMASEVFPFAKFSKNLLKNSIIRKFFETEIVTYLPRRMNVINKTLVSKYITNWKPSTHMCRITLTME